MTPIVGKVADSLIQRMNFLGQILPYATAVLLAETAIRAIREPSKEMLEASHIMIGCEEDQVRSWQYAIDTALYGGTK